MGVGSLEGQALACLRGQTLNPWPFLIPCPLTMEGWGQRPGPPLLFLNPPAPLILSLRSLAPRARAWSAARRALRLGKLVLITSLLGSSLLLELLAQLDSIAPTARLGSNYCVWKQWLHLGAGEEENKSTQEPCRGVLP